MGVLLALRLGMAGPRLEHGDNIVEGYVGLS